MKYLSIFIAVLMMTFTTTAAQTNNQNPEKKERKVSLSGEVYDSFTKAKIKAFMTIMEKDSTVVDTMTCWTWGTESYYSLKVPARQADFIIKAEADGYETTFLNYNLRHIARNNHFDLPRILMKKKLWKESELGDVVVKGTRVKIAYRGDTIVYNASAFNLPEGSMLDGLIRQMPGAELKDNGDIYINGKKIDYLTLNGKDFFKGKNKVMLDNLPYYTVQNIKVYNKSTDRSRLTGHDIEKKDYVMDVNLKREYNRGYIVNTELGGGTDERYLARIFGLYYDDHTRLSVFGNANNINENRRPGGEGEWRPSNMPQGQTTTKQAGISLSTEDADKNIEETFDAMLMWSKANNQTRKSSLTFATDGNILGGSESSSISDDFRFSMGNSLMLKKPFSLYSTVSLSYTDGDRQSWSKDSTYREKLINLAQNSGLNRYKTLNMAGSLWWNKKFEWGDYVAIFLEGEFEKQKPSESFSRNLTRFSLMGTEDYRHYYEDTHQDSYNYAINASYVFQMLNNWYISAGARYDQQQQNFHNSNYRLDWLGGMTDKNQDLGWLPSARELAGVVDPDNTDYHIHMNRSYSGNLEVYHSANDVYLSFSLPIKFVRERMHFDDGYTDTIAVRNYTNFTPSFSYSNWGAKKGLEHVGYYVSIQRPDFASLMPCDDQRNPRSWQVNNPDLKPTISHNINLRFRFNNDSLMRNTSLWANATIVQQSWGTRTAYDKATGAYMYLNDNINGNWNASIGVDHQMPLDKDRHLMLSTTIDGSYTHSVDFDIEYRSLAPMMASGIVEIYDDYVSSIVHNWLLHDRLSLEYQLDKLTAGISGDFSWRRATSHRENFERINTFDYNYGGRIIYTLPWVNLNIATDLRMYSRRGYGSSMMNTDDLIWNAELSRSLLKQKLTVKLTAFDLLHQLSNKSYSINAQGRTETWNNCIPRYVMLSLAYKFTHTPVKKK